MIQLIIILGVSAPFGMACGFMFFIHPVLGIATVVLFYFGFSYCDAALERRREKGIQVRTEQLLDSLAEIPLGADWRLKITVSRFRVLFYENPSLVGVVLCFAPGYDSSVPWPILTIGAFLLFGYVLSVASQLPRFGNTALVLGSDGVETCWNGFIPWQKVREIDMQRVISRGGEISSLTIRVDAPRTTLEKFQWTDRFRAAFHLGALKNGKVSISLNSASEKPEVVRDVANALWRKRTCSYDWNAKYLKQRRQRYRYQNGNHEQSQETLRGSFLARWLTKDYLPPIPRVDAEISVAPSRQRIKKRKRRR